MSLRFGRWLRIRIKVLAALCEVACFVVSVTMPRRSIPLCSRIIDWFEARALRMVDRDAEVELV